ncbi:uncharacterized protein LOC127918190 [Oncorhynchus keta]|uniref:uncharacterized protein LOC127918190 n=1 Tax=Oncorhynchus keta TaxID=8018 RepID=UPI00227A5B10|nr:uncharacterized protein LOC127918190 [Oncorhynchus keta]
MGTGGKDKGSDAPTNGDGGKDKGSDAPTNGDGDKGSDAPTNGDGGKDKGSDAPTNGDGGKDKGSDAPTNGDGGKDKGSDAPTNGDGGKDKGSDAPTNGDGGKDKGSDAPTNGDGGKDKLCVSKSKGRAVKASPETPPLKNHPSLLRRSFSFRHWTGGELLRIRALSKDQHHGSSGCVGRGEGTAGDDNQTPQSTVLQNPAYDETGPPKRNTLEVGAVLNKTDSMTELSRWERARGKNRTLDNSDLITLSMKSVSEKEGFLRGTGSRSSGSDRRLVRFFSGIFSRKDGGMVSTSTPWAAPALTAPSGRGRGAAPWPTPSPAQRVLTEEEACHQRTPL